MKLIYSNVIWVTIIHLVYIKISSIKFNKYVETPKFTTGPPKAETLENHFGTQSKLGLYGPNSNLGENFNRLGLASDSKILKAINPTYQIQGMKSGDFSNISSDARSFITPATAGI